LRSTLVANLEDARSLNAPHRDLLGLNAVKIFEIGTVFASDTEEFRVGLAVQSGTTYKAKDDDALMSEAVTALEADLGVSINLSSQANGLAEFSLDAMLAELPKATAYEAVPPSSDVIYETFSIYPAMSRDIAMWVPENVDVASVSNLLEAEAGDLCVRITHLDTFTKEGRTSLAFRLVFQANDRTLTDSEVEPIMLTVYEAVKQAGFEAR
jgi:phenylalanyl-tRNA synthetase beta subunit